MKSILAAAVAATALMGATPLLAQPYGHPAAARPGHDLRDQEQALETRIRQGIQQGQIDRVEADRAYRQLAYLRDHERDLRVRAGGVLTEADRVVLQQQLDQLSQSIHWMRSNGRGPGPAVGGWDLDRREAWLEDRVRRGLADGSLDRSEAWRVQSELRRIRGDEAQMRRWHGGALTPSNLASLQTRLDRLSDTIRWLRRNDERRPW